MGKDWSKGLTKETDARVARAAAGHLGLRYVRRTPLEQHKRGGASRRKAPLKWNVDSAYALGLAATDGCLVGDGRHVSMGSEDREQVEAFVRCVGRPNAYVSKDADRTYFRAQLGDVELYRFLLNAGLTPRKSLTLGKLRFPPALFWDVARGLIDGDGSISNYVHNPIKASDPNYQYERFHLHFLSASLAHATWIKEELKGRGLTSALIEENRKSPFTGQPSVIYKVKLGKHASIALAAHMYADPTAPRLERKWRTWDDFRRRYSDAHAAKLVRLAGAAGRSYAAVSRTAGLHAHEGSNPSSGTDSPSQ
jgi:hypothetical protein